MPVPITPIRDTGRGVADDEAGAVSASATTSEESTPA